MIGAAELGHADCVVHRICARFSTSSTSMRAAFLSATVGLGAETTTALLRSNAPAGEDRANRVNSSRGRQEVSEAGRERVDPDRGTTLMASADMRATLTKAKIA